MNSHIKRPNKSGSLLLAKPISLNQEKNIL